MGKYFFILQEGTVEFCRLSYEVWHNLYLEMTSELAVNDLSHHVRLTLTNGLGSPAMVSTVIIIVALLCLLHEVDIKG